jgi:hypothetical protein
MKFSLDQKVELKNYFELYVQKLVKAITKVAEKFESNG